MRFLALACDYDGTLVHGKRIDTKVMTALHCFKKSGRKVILVTGRTLESLLEDFGPVDLFDRVVVENGGVIYQPETGEATALACPPPMEFLAALQAGGIGHLVAGKVVVSTHRPFDILAEKLIKNLGLDLNIIYNKDSVMILPTGVDKSTGLRAALNDFGYSIQQAVGVGDAENDVEFLSCCGYSAAVANAISRVKMQADLILSGTNGSGIIELTQMIMESDV